MQLSGESIVQLIAWLNHVMEIFALFMVCGVFTTLLIPETKRRSLEELAETYHGDDEGIASSTSVDRSFG